MLSPVAAPIIAFVAGVFAGVGGFITSHLAGAAYVVAIAVATILAVGSPALFRVLRGASGVRAWKTHVGRLLLVCVSSAAGVCHGATARDDALHTSLREALDGRVGGAAIDRVGVLPRHDPLPLRARLTEDAADGGEFVSLRVQAQELFVTGQWRPVRGGLVLTVNGTIDPRRAREWSAGRVIEAPVTFRRPTRYLNTGVRDFEHDAALSGITLLGSVKSGLLVDVLREGSRVEEVAASARATVRNAVARWVRPHGESAAAIVTAVLIGDRTGLPDDERARLQAAGTYHVIAISGGNIAILAAVILAIFSAMGGRGPIAALAAISVLLMYAALVTAGPSVWRATIMAVLFFAARVFDHRTPAAHALLLAAAAIALVQPLDVRDAGFLLTFGATGGLLGAGTLASRWTQGRGVATWVVASLLASVAAEIALLPVSSGVFSRVTAAGLILNLIAIPAMAIVQVGGMIVVLCSTVAGVAAPVGWVAAQSAAVLIESARLVDYLPALVRRVPPPPVWLIATYYGCLVVSCRTANRIRVGSAILGACAGVLIVTGTDPLASPPPGDRLRLRMLDVGQGESLLLQVPGAAPMLIDTGGAPFGGGGFDIGGRVIAPALWAAGIRRLGVLMLTHSDPDHLGGATSVAADFAPATIWWGTPVPPHRPSTTFLEKTARKGSVIAFRRQGEAIQLGDARIRVLHPPPPDWERQKVRNDDSVVVEIVYGNVAMLLTGDISSEVERTLIPQLTAAPIRILKVAHHGSRTSTSAEFLAAFRPRVALVSAGRGNTFGHPAPEVLRRLDAIGARVYRTDRSGEVTIDTDGRDVSVRVTDLRRASP